MPPPLPRCSGWAYSSLISPSRVSLPRKGRRVGLHIDIFEACSAFTRVAACTLALSPIRDTLIEGFSHFVTSMTAPIASGWSESPGGPCTHWKAPPCHGAPPLPPLRGSWARPFLKLLVLMQSQAPPFETSEDILQWHPRRNRQSGRGLALKPLGERRVGEPAHLPPAGDFVASCSERRAGRQFIALHVLVYSRGCWHQVPKVAARPRRPRQAVIDVEP